MKETITGKELVLYILENDLMDKSIELGSATIHYDRSDNELDKDSHEGDGILVKDPWEYILNVKTSK